MIQMATMYFSSVEGGRGKKREGEGDRGRKREKGDIGKKQRKEQEISIKLIELNNTNCTCFNSVCVVYTPGQDRSN